MTPLDYALHTKEQRFYKLLETLPLIVYSVEPTPPYAPIYVSRGIEALGYAREEWVEVPDRWIRSIHPDDRARVLAASERAFARREPLDEEYRMLSRAGEIVWIHDRGSFVLDDHGEVLEWRGILIDVTARKLAELRLAESEERYRRLIDASPDAIFVHARGRILFANPAAVAFFGAASLEALAGVSVPRMLHRQSRRDVAPRVREVIAKGQTSAPVEVRWVTLDGRVVDSEVTGSAVTVQGQTAVQVTARDISARKRADEKLNHALALLEATIESTTEGILVVDNTGHMTRMNRRFVELWRLPEAVLETRNDDLAITFVLDQLEHPEAFLAKVRELYASPDAESFDVLRFKDGRVYERASRPQKLRGETVGRVWSFRDVTRRIELEAQLRQSQKMDAIGSLAGGVAHDFNNILTVIRGNVELMLADESLTTHRADLSEVYAAAERAMELTRQLLAFSRKQVVHPVPLDLADVVRELQPMLRRLIGEDIAIEMQLASGVIVQADRGQIEQVLLNLVVNARDAMPRGGRVRIRAQHLQLDAPRRLRGATIAPGRYAMLEIQDSGEGIAAANIDRVFEPFFTTKSAGKGTGLGLATVYGIVKHSGGFVDVESQADTGTLFRVLLPAADHCRPATKSAEVPVIASGSGKVLVVEDEFAVRRFVQRALERRGYEVLTAESGQQAIDVIRNLAEPVDLIVTDVVMPGMSGTQLIQELRASGVGAAVLYMSGYTDDEMIRRGVQQSEMQLLAKPFTTPQLTAAVAKALRNTA